MSKSARRHHRHVTTNSGRRLFLKRSCILLGSSLYGCGGGGGNSPATPDPGVDPAVIQMHPAGQTIVSGNAATFQVVATGGAPLSYQWQRDGVDIPGANQAVYVLGATAISDDGASFSVRVTNPGSTTTSTVATLQVVPAPVAPTITSEPADATVLIGQDAIFEVSSTATAPVTYQWLRDGIDILGATGPSYTAVLPTLADNGATFSVTITNQAGSASSRVATLNVTSTGTTIDTTAITVDTILITVDEV